MIKIIKAKNKYRFLNNKKVMRTQNNNILEVENRIHANLILKEFFDKNKLKDPFSIINLTLFSCNLIRNDIIQIKRKIFELLNYDFILYRSFDENDLIKLMDKTYNPFIEEFKGLFNANLFTVNSFFKFNNVKSIIFKNYLNELTHFRLTVLYKLSSLTNSVILSYFYINQKINNNSLYKLSNIEYTYQQKRWGIVEEQKMIDRNYLQTIKKISFFFKNIN